MRMTIPALGLRVVLSYVVEGSDDMKNGRVQVGIIGTGFGLSAQLPGFRACEDTEVVAICGSNPERTSRLAEQHGIPQAYTDYRTMLELDSLDLVSIVTPVALHHPMTLAAFQAGKHVLCEKPMAMNLTEAKDMLAAAKASARIHLIDHELRFNPTRVRLKELLDGGYVGEIYHATVTTSSNFRADPDARTWDWWSDAKQGGGSLGATASHQVDLLRWWIGEISEVSAEIHTFVKHRRLPDSKAYGGVTSDDYCSLMLRFENGQRGAVLITSVARQPAGTRFEIHGSQGSLILDADERLWGRQAADTQLTELTVADPNRELPGIEKNVWAVSFIRLAQEVVTSIREGRAPTRGATFLDGAKCQAVLDAARVSWQDGVRARVPEVL